MIRRSAFLWASDLALGDDPDLPADNIVAGACYLGRMYDRFGYPGLFGAYNAGPARYAAWLAGGTRLPGETAAYLRAVGAPTPAVSLALTAPRDPLFVVRRDAPARPPEARPQATAASLFVLRREVP